MSMTKLEVTRKVVKFIVGASTSWTVTNVIANNVNPEKAHQKVEAVVGGIVVGSMVADAAEAHINKKIDDIVAYFKTQSDTPPSVNINLV